MDFMETIDSRFSVRRYSDRPIPEESLARIMEATRNAPSACNIQPWHFYIVRDEATRKALFPNERQAWIASAPVVVVACSIPEKAWVRSYDRKNYSDVDISIAMEHLILSAAAEGLGTCWIGSFDPDHLRKVLRTPEGMMPIAATPLGYGEENYRAHDRKPLEEIVTIIG